MLPSTIKWRYRLLAVSLLTFIGCLRANTPGTATAVNQNETIVKGKTFVVSQQVWPQIAKVQGSLFADEVATIAAKVAGRVVEVNCDLGDQVITGQTLIKLDTAEYELLAAQAEAQLTQARAAVGLMPGDPVEKLNPLNAPPVREASAVLDEAKQSIKRLQMIFTQGAVVATDLEVAQAAATVADARYNSALNSVREKIALIGVQTAQLGLAEERLRDTTIAAPFTGMIQNRSVAVGTYVNVGQPMVELVGTSVLRYRAAVPERFVGSLKIGQRVTLHLHDQEDRNVQVTRISPALDPTSRSLTFEAEVPNEDGSIRSGSFAQADIVLDDQSQTIAVPSGALMRFAGVDKAWRVVDGKVSEAVVQIGREQDGLIEIISGLKEGDRLLIDGRAGRVGRFQDADQDTDQDVQVAAPDNNEAATSLPQAVPTSVTMTRSGDISTQTNSTTSAGAQTQGPQPGTRVDSPSSTTDQSALGR